ncbi:UDP-glycosyltransferase 87A1-like [Papaver somniferum]|uniref:UDP-glycosyltransferase 87A1-like n=1 Tax=Papaver somniferum TaxID=3469 RepID=UPI000E6F7C88|nr:UDP-glycosyltransferase 87A1-like [Papaver somniferum]
MEEILAGLQASGVRYLLVSRGVHLTSGYIHGGDGGEYNKKDTRSQKFIVPWCDQLRVLCHSSIGGFLTHCGWNSVMESLYAGVPMLTFSVSFDQIPNRKLIVDDLKVGMKFTKEFGEKALVKRGEVEKIVKKFMDINKDAVNNEAKEMRRRSSEVKEMCRKAPEKGGSYDTNLNAFIKDILHFPGN